MLLIHGHYRLAPKLIAYRNDWCNHCGEPVLAQQWRSFYLGHLYWIPLIPLGFRKNWQCTQCARDPRERVRTSLAIILAGLLTFTLACVLTFLVPHSDGEATIVWTLRGIFGSVSAVFAFWLLSRSNEQPPPIKYVEPLRNERCLICGGRMTDFPRWHCVDCGGVRYGSEQARVTRRTVRDGTDPIDCPDDAATRT